jgi:histidine triad (HIT) family protein
VTQSCIFCQIVRGDIAAERVFESHGVVAIRDIHPQAPVHVLVVPKEHVDGIRNVPVEGDTWSELLAAIHRIVATEDLHGGFRLVINDGNDGGQTVPHLHVHILGGRSMQWPPG